MKSPKNSSTKAKSNGAAKAPAAAAGLKAPNASSTTAASISAKTDAELRSWIENHERKGATDGPLYAALVEEEAHRKHRGLAVEASLQHLMAAARQGRFATYGSLASASGVPWFKAKRLMNGPEGHLDLVLKTCRERGLPPLASLCVSQEGLRTGVLTADGLAELVEGARRVGYAIEDGASFLRQSRVDSFEWGKRSRGPGN